jgi:hypothetical protein
MSTNRQKELQCIAHQEQVLLNGGINPSYLG